MVPPMRANAFKVKRGESTSPTQIRRWDTSKEAGDPIS